MRDWPALRNANERIKQLESDLEYWKEEASKQFERALELQKKLELAQIAYAELLGQSKL